MLNLHEKYSKRYRKDWDESRQGLERDPQLMILRGRRGHVYVDGDTLCVATDRSTLTNKLRTIPGVVILQDGDDGANATFLESSLPKVAKLVQLYRRRQMSPEQREAAAQRLKAWRRAA